MKPEEQAAYEQLRRHKELRLPFNESAYIGTFLAGVKWARENAGWVSVSDRLPSKAETDRGVEWRMVSYNKQEGEK